MLVPKPSALSPEQRLSRRITGLIFLLGMLLGSWLTLGGVMEYISDQSPASPLIGQLVGPLMCIPAGLAIILLWVVQGLRKRLSSPRASLLDAYSWPFSSPAFGGLWIWIGVSQLIARRLDLNSNLAIQMLLIGAVVGVIGMFAELLLVAVRNRRTAQQ